MGGCENKVSEVKRRGDLILKNRLGYIAFTESLKLKIELNSRGNLETEEKSAIAKESLSSPKHL